MHCKIRFARLSDISPQSSFQFTNWISSLLLTWLRGCPNSPTHKQHIFLMDSKSMWILVTEGSRPLFWWCILNAVTWSDYDDKRLVFSLGLLFFTISSRDVDQKRKHNYHNLSAKLLKLSALQKHLENPIRRQNSWLHLHLQRTFISPILMQSVNLFLLWHHFLIIT